MASESVKSSKTEISSVTTQQANDNDPECDAPDFIYGGPFIKCIKPGVPVPGNFINTATPINLPLQGTFKQSFAYRSLKDRMPVILTKVIDYCSRDAAKIKSSCGATDDHLRNFIQYVTKLKNDVVTNKEYDILEPISQNARDWNKWMGEVAQPYYFQNTWLFTECYIYRRLREGCELNESLKKFDYFDEQKDASFNVGLEPMCIVAENLMTMLEEDEEKDKAKRKEEIQSLLKIALWSNKCDLSLSMGSQIDMMGGKAGSSDEDIVMDPFEMVLKKKDFVLVDDSGKFADYLLTKSEALYTALQEPEPEKTSEDAAAAAAETQTDQPEEEKEKPPCPAKITKPTTVMIDIVCDNAGYEFFSDLCLAYYLVKSKLVDTVRFHVKSIPWFVSDVTARDFDYVMKACTTANYSRKVYRPPKEPVNEEGEENPPEEWRINSDKLQRLGQEFLNLVADGTFEMVENEFWTTPVPYKDMKKNDPRLYRLLQFPIAVIFKGDLNYRKLLADKNCPSTSGFEAALQGFMPTPVLTLRTVKSDVICGLPNGKMSQLKALDNLWMEKGDYAVIQFLGKCEALKESDRPCEDYGDECRGVVCPERF